MILAIGIFTSSENKSFDPDSIFESGESGKLFKSVCVHEPVMSFESGIGTSDSDGEFKSDFVCNLAHIPNLANLASQANLAQYSFKCPAVGFSLCSAVRFAGSWMEATAIGTGTTLLVHTGSYSNHIMLCFSICGARTKASMVRWELNVSI